MQSTRFIVVADLHLNLYFKYSKPNKDVNSRFHHQRLVLRKIFALAKKYKAGVIFDGDLFDQRVNPDCRVVNMAVEEINRGALSIEDQDVFILAGNHDQTTNERRPDNSLGVFNYLEANNIWVIDKPYMTSQADTGDTLYFIPYSEDKEWLQSYLDKWAKDKYRLKNHKMLLAHIGVANSRMGAHLVRLSGEFNLKDLHHDYFQLILMGHYHLRQYLTKDKKVLYVGSTIPFEHADDNQTKGVSYVDLDKLTEKFIPIKSPLFETIDTRKTKLTKDQIIKLAKNNFVRVVSDSSAKLRNYAKHGIDTMLDKTITYKPRLDITPKTPQSKIVKKYCYSKYNKQTAPKVSKLALSELKEAYNAKQD